MYQKIKKYNEKYKKCKYEEIQEQGIMYALKSEQNCMDDFFIVQRRSRGVDIILYPKLYSIEIDCRVILYKRKGKRSYGIGAKSCERSDGTPAGFGQLTCTET